MNGCGCGSKLDYNLIFACSGASNTGCLADRAARILSSESVGTMSCMAAVAARDESALNLLANARRVLVIDGCEKDCARRAVEGAASVNLIHMRITDQDMDKNDTPITYGNCEKIAAACRRAFFFD